MTPRRTYVDGLPAGTDRAFVIGLALVSAAVLVLLSIAPK